MNQKAVGKLYKKMGANIFEEAFHLDHGGWHSPETDPKRTGHDKPLTDREKLDHFPSTYLKHLYNNLPSSTTTNIKDPVAWTGEENQFDTTNVLRFGTFYKFDQKQYITDLKHTGFQDEGYLFVPHQCKKK